MPSTNLGLPFITDGQSQKHITHNEALDLLDAIVPAIVASATTTTAPGSPVDGEAYVVPTGSAFGAATPGQIAIWLGGQWNPIPAPFGHRVLCLDTGAEVINAGSGGWVVGQVVGAFGAALGLQVIETEIDLGAAGGTQVTATDLIPNGAIILGIATTTNTAITGPAAFKVGVSGELEKFGGFLNVILGSKNAGLVGPYATYADVDVLVTAQDDITAFTAGVVRLAVFCITPTPTTD